MFKFAHNISIRIKLAAVVLICVVGLVVYMTYVVMSTRVVQTRVASSLMTFPMLQLIAACRQQAEDMRADYAVVVSSQDSALLVPARQQAELTKKSIAHLAEIGRANGLDESQLVNAFSTYYQVADTWAKDRVEGSIAAGTGQNRLYQVAFAQRQFNENLDALQKELYHEHDSQLNSVKDQAKLVTIVGLTGGIILCIGLFVINAIIVRRFILRPLDQAVAAANRITTGDWFSKVSVHGRDEIGKLLDSIENLRSHLLIEREAVERRSAELQTELQQRKLAEIELSKLSKAVENSAAGIFIANAQGLVVYANQKFLSLTGYDGVDVIGYPSPLLKHGRSSESIDERWVALRQGLEWRGEFQIPRRDGSTFWALASLAAMLDDEQNIVHVVGNIEDVSKQKESEEVINRLAFYDALTSLPNRRSFTESLPKLLDMAARSQKMAAVCYVDLDHFKEVNDTLGHAIGDSLLRTAAKRLQSALRTDDFVSRLGGDEFALIISNLDDVNDAYIVARKIIERMTTPFKLDGRELTVTASIGIAFFPDHGTNADNLLKRADIALYHAKSTGRNNFQIFSEEQEGTGLARLEMEAQIRSSIEKTDFFLEYQPKYCTKTGRLTGAEALIRWNHPTLGRLSPDKFIALAEESRLIVPLGYWIIAEVASQLAMWRDLGLEIVPVAVNLSTVQFANGDLPDYIANTLKRFDLNAKQFDVEITESLLMDNPDSVRMQLERLDSIGVGIAIDDFGTGYSSLSYLRRLPIDVIKIDRCFVQDIENENGKAIIEAIMAMAKALEMSVVAEGVETENQLQILSDVDCDFIQGYLFSKPLEFQDFEKLLAHVNG
ncbi:MAG: EAL domain-containing protein [Gammaproteobacteria bacterium]|nr:EAL domain-containing protein [Gammaproteobacteria bacterium]